MAKEKRKYAVLKWEDWLSIRNYLATAGVDALLLDDAEVIRKQDITSGPVFHLYANIIHAFVDVTNLPPYQIDILRVIADHFHEAGLDADAIRSAGRAKLPD